MTHLNGKIHPAPDDLDLGCSAIKPWQYVATVAPNQLPELSEIRQWEFLNNKMGHPVFSWLAVSRQRNASKVRRRRDCCKIPFAVLAKNLRGIPLGRPLLDRQ